MPANVNAESNLPSSIPLPSSSSPPAADARISVVVLTYQRASELERTLRQLCNLPEKPPIIVVDNASSDNTAAMVQDRFPAIVLIRAPRNLGAAGRNLGAARVRTPYVAFCDDDTWWAAGSLCRAADLFDRYPRVAALTARVLVGPEQREDPTSSRMATSPLARSESLPGPPILGLMAGATAFRSNAFLAMGGYHPRFFLGGEETVLALDLVSAGWQLVYAGQLTVFHQPSPLRNARQRSSLLARNAVWTAWLRLPASRAWLCTLQNAPRLWRDAGGIAGWRDTLRGLSWVLRERRVIPPAVEAMRVTVSRQLTSIPDPNRRQNAR